MDLENKGNIFTSREQELLLKAALLSDRQAPAALAQWVAAVDLEAEMDNGSFRLLPLLFHNLKKLGIQHPVMTRLKGIYRYAWYKNHQLFFELSKILKSLHQAGVPTMVLKGAALTALVYQNLAIRPMYDMDILVPADSVEFTHRLLQKAGWSSLQNRSLEKDIKYRHSLNYISPTGTEFDLHWHPVKDSSIVAYEKRYDKAFWQTAVPIKIVDAPSLAAGLPESLFLVIAHGTWENKESPIRWIADALFIIRSFQSRNDWRQFLRLVKNYGLPLQVARALVYLQKTYQAAIPQYVFDQLGLMRVTYLQQIIFHCSLGRPSKGCYAVIKKIPGIVEYLRVSGDRGMIRLLAGFPEFVRYRMHKKNLQDLIGYISA
jgi:hypothetical protein